MADPNTPGNSGIPKRSFILEGFFFILLIALSAAFIKTVSPFLFDIFFAMLIAALSWGMNDMYRKRLRGKKGLAALLSVLSIFLMVGIPAALLAVVFSVNAVGGIRAAILAWSGTLESLSAEEFFEWFESIPVLGRLTEFLDVETLSSSLNDLLDQGSSLVLNLTRKSLMSISGILFHLFILSLLTFFLFREGERLSSRIRGLLPLADSDTDELLSELKNTTSATLISTFLIGVMEGIAGALLFLVFGLPSPLLFGLVIMVISLVPLVGANLILVPAGIVLLLMGRPFAGIAMTVIGVGFVTVTQNIIKPKLLGNRSGLHPALALISILGGIAWLGILGFIIGPILASLFIAIWEQFGKRYSQDLNDKNVSQFKSDESDSIPLP